jgi:hypothetical protein
MKKHPYIAKLFAIILFASATVLAQNTTPKFDDELRSEFSKGVQGDSASLETAIAKAEKILAANPKDAQTLVWLGSATLAQSGKAFMAGNFAEGGKLWAEGRQKMDKAVSLDGENLEVLFVRGSTYLNASTKYPIKAEADELAKLGKSDLEKIIAATEGKQDEKSIAFRQRASKVFVGYYTATGDNEKAENYRKMLT